MATSAMRAREEVLQRIRRALPSKPDAEAIASEWERIDRRYRRTAELGREAVLEQLEDRLRDYDAQLERVTRADLTGRIGDLLATRHVVRMVVPNGLVEAIGAELPAGFEFIEDHTVSATDLDAMDGVLTGCTVAISQTGSLVLQHVRGQGRRAPTLVPDYHLCVVHEADVVETVPQAMARLQLTATLATTFISGPSATADIEMTRIKGVHGPRFLDVILVT